MAVAVLGTIVIAIFVGVGTGMTLRGMRRGPSHPSCGNRVCRYDVRGLMGHTDRCPECGSRFEDVGITPPGRERNSPLIVTGLLVILVTVAGGLMTSFVIAHRARQEAAQAAQSARQSILLLPNPNTAAPSDQNPPPSTPPDSVLESPSDGEPADVDDE